LPNVRWAEEALKKAKFVVVQEISNKPETLAYADVILPLLLGPKGRNHDQFRTTGKLFE